MKNHRSGHVDSHRRARLLSEKSSSFHVAPTAAPAAMSGGAQIRRPKTVPDLVSHRKRAEATTTTTTPMAEVVRREPPKVLVKVTTMGSLGPVQLVMPPESTVEDLIAATVRQYVKEGRRPILPSQDPSHFELHYSQFSLESLERDEKLRELGSRNFFMCPRSCGSGATVEGGGKPASFGSCSKEVQKGGNKGGGWLRFIDFLF
ncbi:hypothetical protein PIB30_005681 [Stylosanthes scabra]|uniref:DUF7054 domain-containing protein n=1 Tax=Stylosanthes scabra TaxID=79078 RepID=A0ABU6U2R9_9FABA|nr:hypothetical protein [Stylosanthes scabra]